MSKQPSLKAQKRSIMGRKVKTLRREGIMPANIFGKKVKSQAVSVSLKDFQQVYSQIGETGLVELTLKGEKKTRPSLISNVQTHPVTDLPLHADFHQVDLTQKVTANVPIEVIGESPAVKDKGAILITLINEVEVEALPADLPDKFTVDISKLSEFNDSILSKELKADHSKVEIKTGEDQAIVIVQEPKQEEEETPTPTEAVEEREEEEAKDSKEKDAGDAKSEKDQEAKTKDDKKEEPEKPAKDQKDKKEQSIEPKSPDQKK